MSKKTARKSNYYQFERKMMRKMFSLILISIGMVLFLRELIRGRFGEAVVTFLASKFRLDYLDALYIYKTTFRENLDIIICIAIIIALIAVFRYSVHWVTGYFNEISAGCDALLDESRELITLSPEMSFLELKLNECKNVLEKRERDARQAEQRKNDLVVYLAHDLKTPLTSVIGYLTLLRDEPDLSPKSRARYTGVALDKAERLEDLINEFFDITRFNISHLELERRPCDLARMLQQVASEFAPMLEGSGLTCELSLPEILCCPCDPDKLARVFDNLLRNACHYSTPGTVVRIAAEGGGGTARFTFSNTGVTIPPEKLERIFDQFFRLDTARATRTGGAGLGLAIAREIVELHGGTISAQSEDGVTVFTVCLPVP